MKNTSERVLSEALVQIEIIPSIKEIYILENDPFALRYETDNHCLPLVGASQIYVPFIVFSPVVFHHAVENLEILRRNFDQLIPNVVGVRVHGINLAPPATCNKNHGGLIGQFRGQVHEDSKILIDRNRPLTVNFESSRADVRQVTHRLLCIVINELQVIEKVLALESVTPILGRFFP